ncbi:hypothetical protein [Nannocystis pusilla]|uniref:Uncharacterized protein n=1 Tax=Nannocystis pusilla TaxID=889268 RepID=A0ABS7U165_9BACT|nr:hypothetical protein [Nannocystis pusilla]MBZ5714262.1 hypothetical protein [Nannocystis pusilla]
MHPWILALFTAFAAPGPGLAVDDLTAPPDLAAFACDPAPQPGDPPSYCLALCHGIPVPLLASPELSVDHDDLWCASNAALLCQSYGTEYADHCWGWPEYGE